VFEAVDSDTITLLSLLAIPGAAGAAYGGVKAGLNGCRQSLDKIDRIVTRLDERVDRHGERLTVLEVETTHLKNK
tara:strand:- start:5881 stop:6105 length:225 start_codon:yes stop_codon:yes gene_type:complete